MSLTLSFIADLPQKRRSANGEVSNSPTRRIRQPRTGEAGGDRKLAPFLHKAGYWAWGKSVVSLAGLLNVLGRRVSMFLNDRQRWPAAHPTADGPLAVTSGIQIEWKMSKPEEQSQV